MDNTEDIESFPVVKKKNRMDKKTKISFVILCVLLALSLTTTVVLAAFRAQFTANAISLTFANGIKMKIYANNSSAAIKVNPSTTDLTVAGTFTYSGTLTGLSANTTLDGIKCQIDQQGYLAMGFRVRLDSAFVAGNWSAFSSNVSTFTPSSGDWLAKITFSSAWAKNESGTTANASSPLKVKQSSSSATAANTEVTLFTQIVVQGKTAAADVTALAGKTVDFQIQIYASTASISDAVSAIKTAATI